MIIDKTSEKQRINFLLLILLLIFAGTGPGSSIIAQSEQGYILGMKYFQKSFPSEPDSWEYFDNLHFDEYTGESGEQEKLGLRTIDIVGKELIYTYPVFSVDLIIKSDSRLYRKDHKTGKEGFETTKTIHIDKHKTLTSWVEDDNTYVSVFSDFEEGKTSAFLYQNNGEIIPVSGLIQLNDKKEIK